MGVKDPLYLIENQRDGLSTVTCVRTNNLEVKNSLTNCAIGHFVYRGIVFRTVQAAYEAMKFYYVHPDPVINEALYQHTCRIKRTVNFDEVCRLGKSTDVPIRKDWTLLKNRSEYDTEVFSLRDCFMFAILLAKINQTPKACEELKKTGSKHLVDNLCGGEYWSNGHSLKGKNKYGELLMLVRTKLSQT
jgi:predicted NAD-dependent protein-ADP-ribosyltransferase YbiA (DUF1768 family)